MQVRRRPYKRPASQELTTSTSGDGKRRAASKGSADAVATVEAPRSTTGEGIDVDKAGGTAAQETSERTSMAATPATEPSATSADKPASVKHEPDSDAPVMAAVAAPLVAASGTHAAVHTRADSEATASPPKGEHAPCMPPPSSPTWPTPPDTAAPAPAIPASPPDTAQEASGVSQQALVGAGLSMSGVAVAVERELARAAQQGLQPRLQDIMSALPLSTSRGTWPLPCCVPAAGCPCRGAQPLRAS